MYLLLSELQKNFVKYNKNTYYDYSSMKEIYYVKNLESLICYLNLLQHGCCDWCKNRFIIAWLSYTLISTCSQRRYFYDMRSRDIVFLKSACTLNQPRCSLTVIVLYMSSQCTLLLTLPQLGSIPTPNCYQSVTLYSRHGGCFAMATNSYLAHEAFQHTLHGWPYYEQQ